MKIFNDKKEKPNKNYTYIYICIHIVYFIKEKIEKRIKRKHAKMLRTKTKR